jgi:hypothetical protein
MDESGAINDYLSGLWSVACAEIREYVHGGDGFVGKDALMFLVKRIMTGFGMENLGDVAFE